mgnify:CR=1 FL=1
MLNLTNLDKPIGTFIDNVDNDPLDLELDETFPELRKLTENKISRNSGLIDVVNDNRLIIASVAVTAATVVGLIVFNNSKSNK